MTGYAQVEPVPRDKPHWYLFTHYDCPVCGSSRTEKTRMPGKKPKATKKNPWPGHEFTSDTMGYDYCDIL